jgi:hypothetical protein
MYENSRNFDSGFWMATKQYSNNCETHADQGDPNMTIANVALAKHG